MNYKRISYGAITMAAVCSILCGQSSLAQSRYQTGQGRQTVAPSQMPQQPSAAEDFSIKRNIELNSIPQDALDQPGLPSITGKNPGVGESTKPQPRMTSEGPAKAGTGVPPKPVTTPGGVPQEGSLVLPGGVPSTVRIGPIEPIPTWFRWALAGFILFQFVVVSVTAIALYMSLMRSKARQGGHLIRRDYREPIVHR